MNDAINRAPFTKEQIDWLHENLKITTRKTTPFSNSNSIDVILELDGNPISFAYVYIPEDHE